jgi:hypothetical protein
MTRLTLALYLAAFGLIGLNVGRYVLSPSFDASPASATTAPPVGPESAALKASRGMESRS